MVVYDLICSQGHRFEGWFTSLDELEDQLRAHLLSCPVCGDETISRRPSTFGVVKSGRAEATPPAPVETGAENPLEFLRRWRDFSARMEKEYDDVGSRFTEEALKMHYGVTGRRNIRGLSTDTQEEMLRKEGVDFFKIPLLTRKHPSTPDN